MSIRWFILLLFAGILLPAGFLGLDWYRSALPLDAPRQFVGKGACVECHQEQVNLFHGSHHDRAMDWATDQTVLANFNDQSLEHDGMTSRMFRRGGEFWVHTEGPNGEMADFQVKWVFGYHPLQQYLVELNRPEDALPEEIGRVQVLRLSWDVPRQSWFYLQAPDVKEKLEPGDPLHWTGITQNWNTSCAYCHSTNLKKNYDLLADNYRTTFSEINVSCEACHGPGSLHVELANRKSFFWDRQHGFGLANLKTDENRAQVETCAACHSRRSHLADDFRPGCNYHDYFAVQLLTDPIYHYDGQILDENYVYGSFVQSKMYHAGIKCTDCHDPHSVQLKHSGNQVCTSCHQHPAGKYDTPAHHFHPQGGPGSQCVDCHMPETTYMMCDPRRDHSFRVPRPDLSVRFGTPNACSGCHLLDGDPAELPRREDFSQYLDWVLAGRRGDQEVASLIERVDGRMLEAVENWYPAEQREERTGYYEQLALGQADLQQNLPSLLELAKDLRAPAIFRASAISAMVQNDGEASYQSAVGRLSDPSPLVVTAAITRLEQEVFRVLDRLYYRIGGNQSAERSRIREICRPLIPLLQDDSRQVRINAARLLLAIPAEMLQSLLSQEDQASLDACLGEYHQALLLEQERGEVQMQLASVAELQANLPLAREHYQHAIRIAPELAGPRSNLAALLSGEKDRLQFRDPDSETIPLLEQQIAELREAEHRLLARDLRRAADLADTHLLDYRYAMSSYLQGDRQATEQYLLKAHTQRPDLPLYTMGLATYYLEIQKPVEAMKYIQILRKTDSNHEGYRALQEKAQQMIAIESMLDQEDRK